MDLDIVIQDTFDNEIGEGGLYSRNHQLHAYLTLLIGWVKNSVLHL